MTNEMLHNIIGIFSLISFTVFLSFSVFWDYEKKKKYGILFISLCILFFFSLLLTNVIADYFIPKEPETTIEITI